MKELIQLHNSSRFLEPATIQKCFFEGKTTHVDKQVCGNGFSTGFLQLSPKMGKVNVVIAPNKAVVIAKENDYNNGKLKGLNRIKFFYGESKEDNFKDAEVLVFVADSFLGMELKLKEISYRIDKVLLDEFHNTEIQAMFRGSLIDFENKVKAICSDLKTSIVTVTASPNLFSKRDILITNEHIKPGVINISKDRSETIKRIRANIKKDLPTVVCTNSATSIYKIFHNKKQKETPANFIMGISLTRSLTELIKIKPDSESNLTIVSSRGFEGFDLHYENANVFFLEDRANEFERFFIANLYQAINRVRKGASYIEYNRLELSNKRKEPFIDIEKEIEGFINDRSISVTSKQKTEYKKYKPFVIFEPSGGGGFTIKKNEASINLYRETLIYDRPFPAPEFDRFLDERKITINHLSEVNNRLIKKVKNTTKEKRLLENAEFIEANNLFGSDYKIQILDLHTIFKGQQTKENRTLYLKHLEAYLRRKNYAGVRMPSERENIALTLLSDVSKYNSLVSKVTQAYDSRSINKYGVVKSAEYRKRFKEQSYNTVCKLVLMFANSRINIPSRWIANRNYNLLTEVGINEIKIVGDLFGVMSTEVDIRNCFPRTLYALNGLELPSDFYGENKRNKLAVNVAINDFFYDAKNITPKRVQKANAIKRLEKLGFHEDVINYLISNFFYSEFKGDLFNFLAFHERNLITRVKNSLTGLDHKGCVRRHDSVILFNNWSDITFLNEFEYMNVKGWFNIKEVPVIKLQNEDDMFDEFLQEKKYFDGIRTLNSYQSFLMKNSKYMAL